VLSSPREIAGPQEVLQANLGHATEPALFLDLGSGAFTQSKMTPVGRPNSATRLSSATASSGVWQGKGSSMMNRPLDSS
jgi:hypothetical protein